MVPGNRSDFSHRLAGLPAPYHGPVAFVLSSKRWTSAGIQSAVRPQSRLIPWLRTGFWIGSQYRGSFQKTQPEISSFTVPLRSVTYVEALIVVCRRVDTQSPTNLSTNFIVHQVSLLSTRPRGADSRTRANPLEVLDVRQICTGEMQLRRLWREQRAKPDLR